MITATPTVEAVPTVDIVVSATVGRVRAYPLSQKAIDAGFTAESAREEYSDQVRQHVREFAKTHGLKVDWSKDW